MLLLDSNILIYALSGKYPPLLSRLTSESVLVSVVSKIEVLGYHRLSAADQAVANHFFGLIPIVGLDDAVVERSIQLRQARKMSLGDAIIAATALDKNCTLLTANVDDFRHIEGLKIEAFAPRS